MWRPAKRAIADDVMYAFLRQTYATSYGMKQAVVWRYLLPLGGPDPDDKCMFCTEWVGALLERCGVFEPSRRPYAGSYLPLDFAHDRSVAYETRGNAYDYGYELDVDNE